MSLLNGLIGKNPTYKVGESHVLLNSDGKLGVFVIDLQKVAFGALALVASMFMPNPLSTACVVFSVLSLKEGINRHTGPLSSVMAAFDDLKKRIV